MLSLSVKPRFRSVSGRKEVCESFAHFLWIRLCARGLTVGKYLDSQGKFHIVQEIGIRPFCGEIRLIEDCAMQFNGAPMFCTFFVDKIVRKTFDFRREP
jgi:hypothetical protein